MNAMQERAWSIKPDGLIISVRLTPKSSRDAIEGLDILSDGREIVKARVRAIADQGKANAAALQLFSRAFDVASSKVKLVSGSTSRIKIIRIEGDGALLAKTLQLALDKS